MFSSVNYNTLIQVLRSFQSLDTSYALRNGLRANLWRTLLTFARPEKLDITVSVSML